jgi:hypothetical protein
MSTPIDRVPVDSSTLSSIGYAEPDAVLEARFRSGDVYRFFLVPAAVWNDLKSAESKGGYFNRHIRDRYPHEIVKSSGPMDLSAELERSLHALKSRR